MECTNAPGAAAIFSKPTAADACALVPDPGPPPSFLDRGRSAARSRMANARVSACGLASGASTAAGPPHSAAKARARGARVGCPGCSISTVASKTSVATAPPTASGISPASSTAHTAAAANSAYAAGTAPGRSVAATESNARLLRLATIGSRSAGGASAAASTSVGGGRSERSAAGSRRASLRRKVACAARVSAGTAGAPHRRRSRRRRTAARP